MNSGRLGRFGLLGALYFCQGLPYGFFTQALPAILRERGTSLPDIGLANLLALPWALKFLFAPWMEAPLVPSLGRRRSWILVLQLATTVVLAGVALVGDLPIQDLLTVVLLMNLLAAAQDVPSDGLAVDLLAPAERGLGNAVQVGGYRVGMIIGGGALLVAYPTLGMSGIFLAMAVLIALASGPILVSPEPPVTNDAHVARSPAGVAQFLTRPGARGMLVLCAVYKLGESFGNAMLRPFLTDHDFSLADLGWLLGTVGFGAGLLGAVVGGAAIRPLGRRAALVGFAAFQGLGLLGFAALAWAGPDWNRVIAAAAVEHFASGMATAALFTTMMDHAEGPTSATDYTVMASAVVIAQGTGAALSGISAEALGYTGHFLLATTLCGVAVGMAATAPITNSAR